MFSPTRPISLALVMLLLGSTLVVYASPAAAYEVTSTTRDPGKELRADWYAGIPIEPKRPTACFSQRVESSYEWYCRSIDGIPARPDQRDLRNWLIDFST